MKPKNLVVFMSDEHNPKILGCYGNQLVKTPNLDALAARGTTFTNAYCNSPICIPARAIFATGRHNYEVGYWDNADPYEGSVKSWHHRLRESGHRVDAIGKLHFRSTEDDNGFTEEIIPLHVVDGIGDLMGLIRDDLPVRRGSSKMADLAGRGETSYTEYDRNITREALRWLEEEAPRHTDKPWVLFVSYVCPHFPLMAPPEFFDLYPLDQVPWPKQYDEGERPDHPYLRDYASCLTYDKFFDEEKVRVAIAAYYGLVSFLDDNIGKVIAGLRECDLMDATRIMYTSDHGDNIGARGLWGKSTMYEEAAGVPWIMAGEDIPEGTACDVPVTHVDAYPTVLEACGVAANDEDASRQGASLFAITEGATPERTILSEYHAMGSKGGAFMIRNGKYKFVYYVLYRPQLFDLEADPEELNDLAEDPSFADVLRDCESKLRRICDPEEVDARCKARQAELIERNGGRQVILERGDFGFSPAPGTKADFR